MVGNENECLNEIMKIIRTEMKVAEKHLASGEEEYTSIILKQFPFFVYSSRYLDKILTEVNSKTGSIKVGRIGVEKITNVHDYRDKRKSLVAVFRNKD